VATAGTDGDHLDRVGIGLVGPEPVDDPEPLRLVTGNVESKSSTAGQISGDMTLTEKLADLAMFGEVGDGLERGVDERLVEAGQGLQVIEHRR
jgi:hypothetical protein